MEDDNQIRIVCEIIGAKVGAKQAEIFEACLKVAVDSAFPDSQLRGLWVHEGVPKWKKEK